MVSVLPQVVRLKRTVLDFFFPQRCLGCSREGALICPSCRNLLPRVMPPLCPLFSFSDTSKTTAIPADQVSPAKQESQEIEKGWVRLVITDIGII